MSGLGNWNRPAVKRRLSELFAYALAGFEFGDGRPDADVPIVYTWDPAQSYGPTLFLGLNNGSAEETAMRRGAAVSQDGFSVHIGIALTGYRAGDVAEEAAMEAVRRIDGVLRKTERLHHADVPAANPASYHGITKAVVNAVTGPYHAVDQAGSGTIAGHVEFYIDCSTTIDP